VSGANQDLEKEIDGRNFASPKLMQHIEIIQQQLRLSPWILQTQTGNSITSRNHAHLRRPAIPPAAAGSRHQEEAAVVKAMRRNSPQETQRNQKH
jgi:hypothetical protein